MQVEVTRSPTYLLFITPLKLLRYSIFFLVLSKTTVQMLLQYNCYFFSHRYQTQIFYVEPFRHFVKNHL